MTEVLISCFFEGMSIEEALGYVERCYGERPTMRQLSLAAQQIQDSQNVEWK